MVFRVQIFDSFKKKVPNHERTYNSCIHVHENSKINLRNHLLIHKKTYAHLVKHDVFNDIGRNAIFLNFVRHKICF